ncbi:MAG: HEPN domain-containing protein [Candidatus Aenigmarchaeota archaeon]|nr:HEPN domain-containing protein [Candidatus Aenigmarchaeota archaeon]
MRTRAVDRYKAGEYLKRAEECKNAMNHSYDMREWNACVINAVHSAIAAADAFCIRRTGIRHAGERHEDALRLFVEADPQGIEIKEAIRHLQSLLGVKTDAEYGERMMKENDAVLAKKHAERFFNFVAGRVR